jgi:hypothetical protein
MPEPTDQSPPSGGPSLRPDPATVRAFWDVLVAPGDTHEVRIPKCRRGPARLFKTTAGYFIDREAAVRSVRPIGGLDAPAVYVTLNPVKPELRARANNRLVTGIAATTTDDQVTRRKHFLVDLDPTRASEIAATDAERDGALKVRDAVAQYLADRDWPDPVVVGMTGNGGELIYRIALPNDEASATLVERCLASLAALFDGPSVTVDQSVYNAARVTKLLGTVSAKGDDVPELGRVWQLTHGVIRPDAAIVTRELLDDLAGAAPQERAQSKGAGQSRVRFDPASDHGTRTWTVAEVLTRAGIGWRERTRNYGTIYELDRCLTSSEHDDGAALVEMASGALDYKCHHNSCRGKGWPEARAGLGLEDRRAEARAGQGGDVVPEPWRLPVPFDAYAVPAFPEASLPAWLADYAGALAVATQTPVDLAGLLGLSVLATAAARRAVVVVRAGWTEPLNLYVLAILPPGTRKTAVFDAVTAPVLDFEGALVALLAPKIAETQQALRFAEGRLKAAETAAVKAIADDAAFLESEARARREELESIAVPVPPQLIADDVTSEALARLLYDHRERMAVFSAEGDLFEIMAGRYSDGSGNFAVYLKGHAGDMLKVNRVGRPPDYVRHPALTLAITAQPAVLEGLARKDGFRGKGLLARPVYAVPASLVGRRDSKAPPASEPVEARYRDIVGALLAKYEPIDALLAEPTTVPEPTRLRFSGAAQARLVAFMEALEPRLGPGGDLSHVPDWAGKLAGLVARVAGLLHLADRWDAPEPELEHISAATVGRAITFGDYALGHALAAFGAMGADPATGGARRLWRWIAERGDPAVRRADAYQALRGQFPKSADLDAPFALLVEYGYLRPQVVAVDRHAEGRRGPQGRPPSASYDVNPLATTQAAGNPGNAGKGPGAGAADDFQHFQDFQQPGGSGDGASSGRRRVAV